MNSNKKDNAVGAISSKEILEVIRRNFYNVPHKFNRDMIDDLEIAGAIKK